MRLRALLFAALALGCAGLAAHRIAEAAAVRVEDGTRDRLTAALNAGDFGWVALETDGLVVRVAGAAPNEADRFRALEAVKRRVDEARVLDQTTVSAAQTPAPPAFALEMLRNGAEVSLIGLVPADAAREILAGIARAGAGSAGMDMLEETSAPASAGWPESLDLALEALAELPRAKISVAPGRVGVTAVLGSDAEHAALEARLRGAASAGVGLDLQLSARRQVISPFVLRFVLRDGSGRFEACTAPSPEDAERIVAAARAAGLDGSPDCAVGQGAPSPNWADAAVQGIAAVVEMGGGSFAMHDLELGLTGPEGIAPEQLASAAGALEEGLPELLSLTATPPPQAESLEEAAAVPTFAAVLNADGTVALSGPLKDETSRAAVASYADALFGPERVTATLLLDPAVPPGWPGRVMAGVEALSQLKEGTLQVTPLEVGLEGWGIETDVDARVTALLAAKVEGSAAIDVRFDADAAEILSRAPPEVCAEEIAAILQSATISFEPGSATIEDESLGIVAAIADIMRACPGAVFEIGGHTDSQGRAESNQDLSADRARAVVAAIETGDPPPVALSPRGYGAERPVTDNDSEAGRARNRRITIALIGPEAPDAAAEPATAGAGLEDGDGPQ